jgi:hypothetical protein
MSRLSIMLLGIVAVRVAFAKRGAPTNRQRRQVAQRSLLPVAGAIAPPTSCSSSSMTSASTR